VIKPTRAFNVLFFSIAILLAIAIEWQFSFNLLLSWVISITLVTFLAYGYDKAIAGSDRTRIPEKVLLALTFTGGTIGAFAGSAIFRHKTLKTSFRLQLWLVVILQVVLVVGYFLWIEPKMS
jgi:uncharacterized membrane protein YsdA (DUF1294 family)